MVNVNLRKAEQAAVASTYAQGTIVADSNGNLVLSVSGNIIPCRTLDPVSVVLGDTVVVEFVALGKTGQAEAWITGRLGNAFRPATGTVTTVPVGSQTITVTGSDGVAYTTATFLASYTPTVNDIVDLVWPLGAPIVIGKAGTVALPPPPPPPPVTVPVVPPPAPKQTGNTPFPASDSGTWNASFGWDTWAQQNKQVYTGGAAYGGPVTGAFFFNNSPKILAGRTINAIILTLGARLLVGNYNSPVTITVYTHTSARKPGGNVSLGASFTVTLKSGAPRTNISVPSGQLAAFAAAFQGGGGWAISGEPYAGFNGRTVDPSSGTTRMYWSR